MHPVYLFMFLWIENNEKKSYIFTVIYRKKCVTIVCQKSFQAYLEQESLDDLYLRITVQPQNINCYF